MSTSGFSGGGPLGETWVAIDLETTGLDPRGDRIIEVGGVKFRGETELARFSSLVNPRRKLSTFVTSLTGISQAQVDSAPDWRRVAPDLRAFLGGLPVVGHNVGFDMAFLRSHRVFPAGAAFDTMNLAQVTLPSEPSYALARLAEKYAAAHDSPHRALSDALATRDVFLTLLRRLEELDPEALLRLQQMGREHDWPVAVLAGRTVRAIGQSESLGLPLGIDTRELARRLYAPRFQRAEGDVPDPGEFTAQVEELFEQGGVLEKILPDFEQREVQVVMASAVAKAISAGENLVVEAGTGVGKSIAYLLGAALHATSSGGTVIVSTNTINLQAQLLKKDVPVVEEALALAGMIQEGSLRTSELKGRGNYLCFRRWSHAMQSESASEEETSLLAKCLVWLGETETGDRSELGPGRYGSAFTRLSAQGAARCPQSEGPCFLRRARSLAHSADIVIVNHALLMSDAALGGTLLPPHDALIVDEAHHLVNVATRHLGITVNEEQFKAELERLSGRADRPGPRGLIAELGDALLTASAEVEALSPNPEVTARTTQAAMRAAELSTEFFDVLRYTAETFGAGGQGGKLRITDGLRIRPEWHELLLAWENLDAVLALTAGGLSTLAGRAERAEEPDDAMDAILLNVSAALEVLNGARLAFSQCVSEPEDGMVYWMEQWGKRAVMTLHGAPLEVGPKLRETLFARERPVVLTGATLAQDGSLERFRDLVGLEGGKDLLLGSPFKYREAALIAVPEDMPEPGSRNYASAVSDAIADVALKLRQRTLVLFTSYSAMDTARRSLAKRLSAAGITLLAQRTDGTPHRVMRELAREEAAVALGVNSLWEGVDLEGASLKALIVPRLPFPVPTEPVVEARAELFADGFNEYMVPEAAMRFRQGFGRLIRSSTDRGAFIVLDRRILARGYGARFQRSLPECTVRRTPLSELGEVVAAWNEGRPV